MTTALNPQLAVRYLALLSPDLEGAAVLDEDGEIVAGAAVDGLEGHRVCASEGGFTVQASVRRTAPLQLFEYDIVTALKAMV